MDAVLEHAPHERVVLYICAGIGCLVAGVVDVLNCFRVTLEMVPAVAEESDDQKWYTDPECEDQKQYEYDDRHPHKTLTLTLNDEVLLAALLDDIAYPREELIHTLTECFLLAARRQPVPVPARSMSPAESSYKCQPPVP